MGCQVSWRTEITDWGKFRTFEPVNWFQGNVIVILRCLNLTSCSVRRAEEEKCRHAKNQRHVESDFYSKWDTSERTEYNESSDWLDGRIARIIDH